MTLVPLGQASLLLAPSALARQPDLEAHSYTANSDLAFSVHPESEFCIRRRIIIPSAANYSFDNLLYHDAAPGPTTRQTCTDPFNRASGKAFAHGVWRDAGGRFYGFGQE